MVISETDLKKKATESVSMPAPKGHKPYPGSEKGGRPKKWTDDLIEKEADAFEQWMQLPDSIWYEDFALEREFHPDYLSEWAKTNEKFCRVYKKSQAWQKSKLLKGGLLNKYNAGFTKFVMGNTCGWYEKTQISGDAANPLEFLLEKVDGRSKELVDDQSQ
jgi:hypothetical protein